MDVKSIATGILSTGHWPAHLGVNTDAEKIEWLARQLEELADESVDAERLENQLERAKENCGELRDELAELGEIKLCPACKLCEVHG